MCFGRCRKRVHPYAPALTSATPVRHPSVIDLNARPVEANVSTGDSLEFSRNCHSCVGPSSTCAEFGASPRSAFEIELQAMQIVAPQAPSVPPRPQRALHPAFEASQFSAAAAEKCTACSDRAANSSILESLMRHPSRVRAESAGVPERVQKSLQRSSLYQDPFASLHFVVLSTDSMAFKIDLARIERERFQILLRLIHDPCDKRGVQEGARACTVAGYSWPSPPMRLELSAGFVSVPIENLEQRLMAAHFSRPRSPV